MRVFYILLQNITFNLMKKPFYQFQLLEQNKRLNTSDEQILNKCKEQIETLAKKHCNCGKQILKLIDDNPDYGSYVSNYPAKLFAQIEAGLVLEKGISTTFNSCLEKGAEGILKKAGLTKVGNAYTLSEIIVDLLQHIVPSKSF